MNACVAAHFACLSRGEAQAEEILNQAQYDAAISAARSVPGASILDVSGGGGLLVLQSGTAGYPPGLSSSLLINFNRTTLDVGGAGAPGATLSLGPDTTLDFTGAVTPPSPGTLAGFLRVGYGGAGALDIDGGTINIAAITGSSDPGRFVVGGGGGTGTSTVTMTDGNVSFSQTGSNYSGFAIGRTAGPAGVFAQSGGTVSVAGTLAADIGTQGGTGTYALSGGATFIKGASDTRGVMYVGSRRDTGTGIAGSGTIHVSDAASFTFYSDNIFVGDARATGTIIQDGAASQVYLQADNGVLFGSNVNNGGGANGGGTGSYVLSAGTLTIAGNSQSASFGTSVGGSGTLEVRGGTLTVLGAAGLNLGAAAGATGTAVQTGGEVTARVVFGSGTGSYSLSGGTLRTASGITGGADDRFTLAGGTLNFLSGTTTSSGFLTTLSAASTFDVDAVSAAWNSVISGSGGLTKTGAGILSLGAANLAYSGAVTITQGTLAVTNTAALSAANALTLQGGATFDTSGLGNAALAIGALEGSGTVALGTSALAVTVATGETAAYSGTIIAGYTSGSVYGRFTKTGGGTLVINGATMADTALGTGEFYVTQGTLAQTGGDTAIAYLDVGTGTTSGVPNVGTISISDGTLTVKRTFSVGGWGGSGTATQTGGTVVTPATGSCTSCGGFYIGNQGGTGVYSLSGGTIDFTGGVLDLGRTNNASAAPFSGTLNVSDTGTLIIRGGNLILGNWLVNASGGGATTTGIGDGILNQTGGTIRVENAGNFYLAARGDGTYNLTGGVLEIGGASLKTVYANAGGSAALNLGGGTIRVLDTALTTSAAATLVAGTHSTIDTNGLGATWSGALTGAGDLRKEGSGTLSLSAANSFTGDVEVSAGTFALAHASALGSANDVVLHSGGTLDIGAVPAGAPYGSYNVVSIGTLDGAGTVNLGRNGLVVNIAEGDTSSFRGSLVADQSSWQSGNLNNSLIKNGSGTFVIDGMSMTRGNFYVAGGTVDQTSGTTSLTYFAVGEQPGSNGIFSVTGGRADIGEALQVGDWGGTGTVNQSGGIVSLIATCPSPSNCVAMNIGNQGGTGTYNLTGGQLLISGGSHSIGRNTGAQPASSGTLNISGSAVMEMSPNGSFGTGFLVIGDRDAGTQANSTGVVNQSGGTLRFLDTSRFYLGGYGAGTYNFTGGTLEIGGASLLALYGGGGNATGSYAFNLGGGTIKVIGSALSTSVNATLAVGTTSTIDTNGLGATWSGTLGGSGALAKAGDGTLTLSAANSYSGGTTLSGGRLTLANAGALGGGTVSFADDATLGFSGGYTLANALSLTSGVVGTIDTGAGNVTLSGPVSGAGALAKAGTGGLTLSGANGGYTGAVSVTEGALLLSGSAPLGVANSVFLATGSSLDLGGVTGGAGLALDALSGTGTVATGLTRLTLSSGTFSGSITGQGGLTKVGAGTLILSGTNSYDGTTLVSGGTLLGGGAHAFSAASATTVAAGGTLDLGGFSQAIDAVALASGTLRNGALAGAVTSAGGTVTGLSGTAGLTATANTTTLSGTNSFSGATHVTGGTLDVSGALTGSDVTVTGGGALTGTGSIAGAVSIGAGGILSGATGTMLAMGSLVLDSAALINVGLTTASSTPLFAVGGNLTLDGTLNITSPSLQVGVSRLFTYGGTLTDNGLSFGTVPSALSASDLSIVANSGRVDLINTAGAVLQFWNGGAMAGPGTGTVNGGSGIWSTTAGNWTDAAGSFNSPMQPQPGFAIFGGTAGTVSVDAGPGTVGVTGLQFLTSGYVIAGDPIALSAASTVIRVGDGSADSAGTVATIAAALTGANGIEKTDLGTLVLTGANTYAGATLISQGTLALAGAGSLAASSGVIANGTFDIAATNAGATIAALQGSGAVNLGARTLTIAQAAGTFSGAVSGTGGLTIAGGTQTLSGASSFSGGVTLSGGSVAVTGASALGSGTLRFAANGSLTFQDSFEIANAVAISSGARATMDSGSGQAGLGGVISGAGGLTKTGTGALTLSGANTYAGGTTLQAGSLVLANATALGSGALSFAANGTVAFGVDGTFANAMSMAGGTTGTFDTAGHSATLAGVISGAGTLNKSGAGTLNLAAPNTYGGGTRLSGGTLGLLASGALGSGALSVAADASLLFGVSQTFSTATTIAAGATATFDTAGSSVTLAAPISGNGALRTAGTGTLTFAGANTYSGGTLLSGGTVVLQNAASLGTGAVSVAQSTRIVTGFSAPFAHAVSLGGGAIATFDTSLFDVSLAGGLSGTGGLGVTGGGQVSLAAPTSYSGATSVGAGTLRAAAQGAFSSASAFAVAAGATLDLGGASQTIGSLSGAGAVQLGAATLTTGADNTDTTFSGAITGTGGLDKVGTGNFTVASTNLYGGDTNILAGTVTVAADGALGTGLVNILGSGALAFAGAYTLSNRLDVDSGGAIDTSDFPVTLSGDIAGSGSVTKTGTGTLTLTGNNSFSGGLFVEGGTLGASSPQALGTGPLAFQGASTFLLPDASLGPIVNPLVLDAAVTLSPPAGGVADMTGAISGAGGIATSGTGTVILGGQNTYAGPTEVGAGGTLRTSAPGSLPAATALTVAPGAQLDLAGNSQSIGSLGGGGAVALGAGTLTSGNNNADSVFTGTLSGSGGFNKVGTGKMVFDGTGTTGPSTVSGGAFIVGGEAGSNASFSGPVTVAPGGSIGGHGTVGPVTVEDGGELSPGNSIGTLTTTGNLVLNPAATFLVEVNATQSDVVHVIGNAQLAGILQVDTSAGWTANYAYVFLTTTGSVTGTFSDVVDDLPLADVEIAYGADSVSLMLVPSGLAFAALAATPNEATTAVAAQSLGAGNAIYNAILLLDAPAAQAAFSSLSGGIYPSAASMYLLDSRFIREATLGRVRTPLGAAGISAAAGPNGAWAQAIGSWGTLDGTANAPSLSRTIAGMFAGMDGHVGETVRLGFAAGYTQTSFDVGGLYSSGSSDDYHAALYGGTGLGMFDLRAGAAFSWHDMTVNRTVAFPGFTDQDIGDASAYTSQVYGELALPWSFAAGALEPFANAAYVHGSINAFTERGGASALMAEAQSDDVVFTTLGLRGAATFAFTVPASVRAMAGWQHAFGDLTPTTQFAFAGGSLPFAVSGVSVPQDALVLEAGLDFALAPGAALGVAYSGLWGNAVSDNAFKGTLQIQF